ncbi:hypothetical protein EDB84DRAFT_1207001 [Lactarius hengduanensis]|nr:hypothetical protein EDB84DRAFT_1207001 [Lactarius hengduanensis]
MTYDIYFSSSEAPILVGTIRFLVFHPIIFRVYLTFLEAVILIFKHATFLRLSNLMSKSALTRAELDYGDANTDLNIRQYLLASSQEHSVELFSTFIMATDIGSFILSHLFVNNASSNL